LAKGKNEELFDAWLGLKYGSLRPGEVITLPVLSGSMMPYLVPGKEIKIQSVSWSDCRPGTIIIYKEHNRLSAHRLLLRVNLFGTCYLYQKGDVNPYGHWIGADRVVGVVIETHDANGHYIDFRTEEAKLTAKKCVRRQIAKDLLSRFLIIPRSVKRMLKG